MNRPKPPAPEYLGPAAHTSSGSNKPINHLVIHSTVSPCVPGGAEAVARYFRSEAAGGSAHYVVDPAKVVQVVWDSVIAWHAPPNPGSLGLELCDVPATGVRGLLRWRDENHVAMLERAAVLTAQLCLAYGVPPVFLGVRGLRAGRRGVTTHAAKSKAFGQSSHWDPGAWPRRKFMRRVRHHHKRLESPK